MIYYCSYCRTRVMKVGDVWIHIGQITHRPGMGIFRYYRGVSIATAGTVS